MAALVQSYPQQSGSVTMLQTRTSSAPTMMTPNQSHVNQQFMASSNQPNRGSFHGMPVGMNGPAMYRSTVGPIQPYAFTSTPSLNTNLQWQQYGGYRASSSPTVPTIGTFDPSYGGGRSRHPMNPLLTNVSYNPSMGLSKSGSRDDSAIPQSRTISPAPRPQSAYLSGATTPQLSFAQAAPMRTSPERYRRSSAQNQHARANSAAPSGSGMALVSHLYNPHNINDQKMGNPRNRSPSVQNRPGSFYGSGSGPAADDMQLYRQHSQEDARRLRRRSMHTLDSADYPNPLTPQEFSPSAESPRLERAIPPKINDKEQKSLRLVSISSAAENSMHLRNGSSESLVSTRSSNSRPSSVSYPHPP
jgi:hypothetical protein